MGLRGHSKSFKQHITENRRKRLRKRNATSATVRPNLHNSTFPESGVEIRECLTICERGGRTYPLEYLECRLTDEAGNDLGGDILITDYRLNSQPAGPLKPVRKHG